MIKYAIFDMDGLLFDTERLNIESFLKYVGPKQGIDYTVEDLLRMIGMNSESISSLYKTIYGEDYDWEESSRLSREYQYQYIEKNGIPIKKGAEELLEWFVQKGVRCALATSSNKDVAEYFLKAGNMEKYFDVLVSGDEVTKGKPDPEIFDIAARKMGCTSSSEAVVFEDSMNGMKAGVDGGYNVIMIPDLVELTGDYPGKCLAVLGALDEAMWILYNRI